MKIRLRLSMRKAVADIQVRANDAPGNPLSVASGIFPSILTDQSVIPYHRRSNHVKKETFLIQVPSILRLTTQAK